MPGGIILGTRTGSVSGDRLVQIIDLLNAQLTARGQKSFVRDLANYRQSADWTTILSRLRSGRIPEAHLMAALDGVNLPMPELQRWFVDAYSRGGRSIQSVYNDVYLFDRSAPRAALWVREFGGQMIREINSQTRSGIQDLVAQGLTQGWSRDYLAGRLSSNLGLTLRQTRLVESTRQSLLRSGMPSARANDMAELRAQALVQQRALVIAQTEATRALEAGKREYWEQAAEAGIIDPVTEEYIWVTEGDDRTCQNLCEPMGQVTVPMGSLFHSPIGPVEGPPLHPMCRCQVLIGSTRTRGNVAGRTTDKRLAEAGAGQAVNRFVNLRTGHVMGKSETGDTYEELLVDKAGDLLRALYGGEIVRTSGLRARTHPIDIEIGNYAAEVKTIHASSANQKTAIKTEERVRKMAYAIDSAAARSVTSRMSSGTITPDVALTELEALVEVSGYKKQPLMVLQVVDDTHRRVRVYAYEGFESRAVSSFTPIGEYRYTVTDFDRAQNKVGHGGGNRDERAVTSALEAAQTQMRRGWDPMRTMSGEANPVIEAAMAWEEPRTGPVWYHGSTRTIDLVEPPSWRRTGDINARIGIHLASNEDTAASIVSWTDEGRVAQFTLSDERPIIYSHVKEGPLKQTVSAPITLATNPSRIPGGVYFGQEMSGAEAQLNMDMFLVGVRDGVLSRDTLRQYPWFGNFRMQLALDELPEDIARAARRAGITDPKSMDTVDFLFDVTGVERNREIMSRTADREFFWRVFDWAYADPWNFPDAPHGTGADLIYHLHEGSQSLSAELKQSVSEAFRAHLRSEGYNTVYYWNTHEAGGRVGEWSAIVLDPGQQLIPRPIWEMSKAELERLRIMGFTLTDRDIECAAHPYMGHVEIGNNWWELSPSLRRHSMMHEVGHSLEAFVYQERRLWMAWESLSSRELRDIPAMQGRTGAERLAEAYALIHTDPNYLRTHAPKAFDFLVRLAKEIGFWLPPDLRKADIITPEGVFRCGGGERWVLDCWGTPIEATDWVIDLEEEVPTLYPPLVLAQRIAA